MQLFQKTTCLIIIGKQNKKSGEQVLAFFGAPQEIRTPDLWFRRPTLYPAELAVHIKWQ